MIPDLNLDGLVAKAKIDYLQVFCRTKEKVLAGAEHRCRWRPLHPDDGFSLTVHDATRRDIDALIRELHNPPVLALEVAVDFKVRPELDIEGISSTLELTHTALAVRFRPEDKLLFGAGFKGGFLDGNKPKPFHRRLPKPNEELVYGHRGEGQNAKLYLKRQDNNLLLPLREQAVRLEVTMRRPALFEYGVRPLSDLYTFGFRRRLAQVFRIIDRVTVRHRARRSAAKVEELQSRLNAAWARAGINAWAPSHMPPDASGFARDAVAWRRNELLSPKDYCLERHAQAHELIGNALRQLDRRMTLRKSGGSGV